MNSQSVRYYGIKHSNKGLFPFPVFKNGCRSCRKWINDFRWHPFGFWKKNNTSYVGVSKNSGSSPKSSILTGFSIINHPFWGSPIFGNTHVNALELTCLISLINALELSYFGHTLFGCQKTESSELKYRNVPVAHSHTESGTSQDVQIFLQESRGGTCH